MRTNIGAEVFICI